MLNQKQSCDLAESIIEYVFLNSSMNSRLGRISLLTVTGG